MRVTLSLFTRVCEIVGPDPLLYPVTFPTAEAVHVNETPGTFATRLITILLPEQTKGATGTAVSVMAGFTVTTTVTGIPAQPLLVGVIT